MAFKLIKLISTETIIADTYKVSDLAQKLPNISEVIRVENDPIILDAHLLLLIDPIQLMLESNKFGQTEVFLSLYLPYSDETIIPLSENKIITITTPNKPILNAYTNYVKEYKNKIQLREILLDKNIQQDEAEELVRSMVALNPKTSTNH